jgi:thymidylate kinase
VVRGSIVAIEGPSAAGKSEVVRAVAAHPGTWPLAEAFDRMEPPPSLDFGSPSELLDLELALLTEESRRYQLAAREASRGTRVIADTGFLGPITYTAGLVRLDLAPSAVLVALLSEARRLVRRGAWGLPDAVLYLEVPAAERQRRAKADPTGHPAGLYARHAAIGELERETYRRDLAPLLGERLRFVRAVGSFEEVAGRLERLARTVVGRPPSGSASASVLEVVARAAGFGNR